MYSFVLLLSIQAVCVYLCVCVCAGNCMPACMFVVLCMCEWVKKSVYKGGVRLLPVAA